MSSIERGRALAPLTTLQLGGPAAEFVQIDSRARLAEALAHAAREQLELAVLGGGSNLIVGDAGFPGLVAHMQLRGLELVRDEHAATLTVQAGEPWEDVVELAVSEGLAGIECLTGIPGSTGATPIQNVGAYGQDVSEVIEAVEVFDRVRGELAWLAREQCAFGYRESLFKRAPNAFVVLSVRFRLRTDGRASVRYGELARALAPRTHGPSLAEVRAAVRALRADKGMLLEPGALASAGSFFTNPIVTRAQFDQLVTRALVAGVIADASELPHYPTSDPQEVKLAAAWLIERAGVHKGLRVGAFGISPRHALALVHHGGGSTAELLRFAATIQQRVRDVFGLGLELEPVRWNV